VANTTAKVSVTNLQYSTNYTIYVVGEDDGQNATSTAVYTGTFRAAVPAPGIAGHYSLKNIQKRRKNMWGK